MFEKGYEPMGHADPALVDALNEAAARADAGQKLALFAIEAAAELRARVGDPIDFEAAARAFETRALVGDADNAVERRARLIVGEKLRLMGDRLRGT